MRHRGGHNSFSEALSCLVTIFAGSCSIIVIKPLKTTRAFNVVIVLPQTGQSAAFLRSDTQFWGLFDNLKIACEYFKLFIVPTLGAYKKFLRYHAFSLLTSMSNKNQRKIHITTNTTENYFVPKKDAIL